MRKRLVSLFITITMICAFIPVIANADMSINIGEYVQMGTYYGQPILWRCVDIDENGPLMLSDKILCIKAYDAGGSDTSGSHGRDSYRESYGSNYWADSNMRSWLNSTASAGNVEWLCGNPPVADEFYNVYNAYDDEAGFLSNFTESERNAMKPVSQKSLVSYREYENGIYTTGTERHEYTSAIKNVVKNYDTAYAEYVTDKMFLMDVKQVNAVYNNGDILGEDYYIGEPTAQCVENSEYKNDSLREGQKWYSLLRSPISNGSNSVRCVNSDGNVYNFYADDCGVGVRPAFYLNLSSSIKSGSGALSDPYTIVGGSGGNIATETVTDLPEVTGDADLKARVYFDITADTGEYEMSEISYDAGAGTYSENKLKLNISLTCEDFAGRNQLEPEITFLLPEGFSFESDNDERSKTMSTVLSDKMFERIKDVYTDVYVKNAEIGTHKISAKISGDGVEEQEISAELKIKPYMFEVEKYRADWLLDSDAAVVDSMENTYFAQTPGKLFVEAGRESGLESAADFWRGMNDVMDIVNDVSKIADIAFEKKDMYEAIIWSIFESSADFNLISKIDSQIKSNGKNVYDYVSGQMKSMYGLTVSDKAMYNSLTDAQKDEWNKLVSDSFESEYPALGKSMDIADKIGIFFDVAEDLEDVINRCSAYCALSSMQDSLKQVLKSMYQQCPANETAMKTALLNCVNVMNSSSADVAAEITLAIAGAAGKRLGQIGMSALWSGVMAGVKSANPAVAVMLAAYDTGTFLSNALFNTDAITEAYHKMDAVVKTEEVARGTYYSLKNKYNDNETEIDAANYNSSIDVMFNAVDKDCESAIEFIDSVGNSFAGNVSALLGDTTAAESKDSVKSIQNSTYLKYESILTGWVYQLEADNKKEYENYKNILDDSEARINKRYHIECPVDVYVYDASGRQVASVIDNKTYVADGEDITVIAYNDEKYVFLDDSKYSLEYRATDSGTMDITIDEYDEKGKTSRKVGFDDLPLSSGVVYSSEDSNEYILDLDGEVIEPDYDTEVDPAAAVKKQIEMDDDIDGENTPQEIETETSFKSTVSSWAKQEVEEAYAEDIVPEILVGEDLTKQVDRAEFAAIAVNLYENLSEKTARTGENPFFDIDGNECKEDIIKAYNLNITNGITDTEFEPESLITREQAATMLTRAYKRSEWADWTLATDSEYSLNSMGVKKFDDDAEISDWAKESVYFMVKWDIINGIDENTFAPKANTTLGESYGYATREQAIVIALRSAKHL